MPRLPRSLADCADSGHAMFHRRYPSFSISLFLLLVTCGGCGDLIPPRPPIKRDLSESALPTTAAGAETRTADAADQDTEEEQQFEGDWNAWYVHRFGSQIIGVTEITAKSPLVLGRSSDEPFEVTYQRNEQLVFRSGQVSFLRRLELNSTEKSDGELVSFDATETTGPIVTRTSAAMSGGTLSIQTRENGALERSKLKLPETARGLFVVEQNLQRRPIAKGETRRVTALLPMLNSVGVIELRCGGEASVAMLDGEYRLLKEVDVMTYQDAKLVDSMVVWVDDQGMIEKSLRPRMRLETIRTDRAKARAMFKRDSDTSVGLTVKGTLRHKGEPKRTTFVLRRQRSDPAAESQGSEAGIETLVPTVANQTTRVSDGQLLVEVNSQSVDKAAVRQDVAGYEVSEADTSADALVDSTHSRVVRLASAIGDVPDEDLARELMYVAHNSLSLAPQGELRAASLIIRDGAAGAIDHAIVLTALLRARKIPARIAFGLAPRSGKEEHSDQQLSMQLTAWVIASIDGRWVSLDPTRKRVDSADQLCLDVPERNVDLSAALAETFRRLTTLRVEVVSVDEQ